jgi:uncharacterized protein (DUF934 family)
MPRLLLRDGRVVEDDWQYLTEIEGSGAGTTGSGIPALIIPFDRWLADRESGSTHTAGRLGVVLLPAHKVEALAPDLARFELVAAEFPGPTDGRGYTQGRLLRERYDFRGELRAAGYVSRDQLFLLARCGFNSFQLAENDLAGADRAFSTFSAEYQPSNDEGLARKLHHR